MTLFGCSTDRLTGETDTAAVARVVRDLSPTVMRVYQQDAVWPTNTSSLPKLILATGASIAVSFKRWDDAKVATFIAGCPTDRVTMVCAFPEPEDDIAGGTLTMQDWRNQQIKLCAAIEKAGRVGQVVPYTCLMQWTLVPASHRNVADYLTPEVLAALKRTKGMLGWDIYCGPHPNALGDIKTLYGGPAKIAEQAGLPWGVFETGCRTRMPGVEVDLNYQAQYWTDAIRWIGSGQIQPPACVLWWNADDKDPTVGSFRLAGPLVQVWKNAPALLAAASTPPVTPIPVDPPPVNPTPVDPPPALPVDPPVDPRDQQITALTGQVNDLTLQLGTEHAHSADVEHALSDAFAALTASQQQATDLQAQHAGDSSHLADLQAQLTTLLATTAELQRQFGAANAQLVTLKQQVASSDAARLKAQTKLKTLLGAADVFAAAVTAAKKP